MLCWSGQPLVQQVFDSSENNEFAGDTLDPEGVAAKAAPGPDPLVGRLLADKYEVQEVIGRGGLGTVYRGVQHPVGREVAIKVIARHRAGDESLRRRFQREALAAAHLKHPAIVALYDFGEDHGELFMVMECVDGRELRDLLTEATRLEPSRAVDIATQVLRGLAHAHDRGLVHRDLKPENIMLSRGAFGEERAQILDFGIVKAVRDDAPAAETDGHETRAGVIMGTPAYLAPEQAYARGVGPATDQYSLGVVLYEMLAGRLPYFRGSEFEIMTSHCVAPYPPMDPEAQVPPAIEAVVQRAMSKKPGDRYTNVKAMAEALEAALAVPFKRDTRPEVAKDPNRTSVQIPRLSTTEQAALLETPVDVEGTERPLSQRKVAILAGGILALGAGLWFALAPASAPNVAPDAGPRTTASAVMRPAPARDAGRPVVPPSAVASAPASAPPSAAQLAGVGGRALELRLDETDAGPARPDATVATEPPKPKKRKRRLVAKRVQKSCAREWASIRKASKGKSLSRGSSLCRRIARLDQRVRAGRCKEEIKVNIYMNLCESGQ